MKKEVSCKALIPFLTAARQKQISLSELLSGIPYDVSYLSDFSEHIEWVHYCKIISNLRPYFSHQDFENMGVNLIKEKQIYGFMLFFSIGRFNKFFIQQGSKIGKNFFGCIKVNTEFIASNNVKITLIIKDGNEFVPEFFLITKGVFYYLGEIAGKNYKLNFYWVNRGAVYELSFSKISAFTKFKRIIQWVFTLKKALLEISESHEALLQQYRKLEESKELLLKQTIILKTAYEITKSIHRNFDIYATLNAIAGALVKEAKFSSVKIKLFRDIEGNHLDIECRNGEVEGYLSPLIKSIIINHDEIGKLIIYHDSFIEPAVIDELFNYIMPVINISVHDALVLRSAIDYRDNLELKVDERTSELKKAQEELSKTISLLQEAQQVQNLFFTNISHEFRTPLTLILGPVKQIAERSEDYKIKEELGIIYENALRLLRLVNQLLDISRLETENMKLHTAPCDIVPLIKALVYSFCSYAERKKINLKFESCEESVTAYIDKEKIEKIFVNILSNAFKFTPEKGAIEINIRRKCCMSASHINCINDITEFKECVEISISDTGIGIPKDKISKIFDRFYQVDGNLKREHEGSGIGLALVKELVELHKGKISVHSDSGNGTTFNIYIPLGKAHLAPEEISEDSNIHEGYSVNNEIFNEEHNIQTDNYRIINGNEKPVILIIEDNYDVRNYIKTNLNDEYSIIESANGQEGWKIASVKVPDLIISDVVMPGMDGFELCNKLKSGEPTSHIPVILLTAKATCQDKIEGLNLGADDYIMKPFEPDELKARIKNLVVQRERIHEHFRKHGLFELEEKKITRIDKQFMEKIIDTINRHISDSSLNVDMLVKNLALSRSVLQRKILSLTGDTPGELIRRIRLKKAALLIEQNFGNISEISLEVGFSNPAYFSEAFKRQFGISPIKYYRKFVKV